MPHIADPNLIALMAELEGDAWRRDQEGRRSGRPHSVNVALTAWEEKQRDFAQDENVDWRDLLENRASVEIYGEGGNNRYVVGADGTVRFSAWHARAEVAAKALALGFELC
jgi:alpha-tubulin suppressor-like RCC1 family protein